MKTALLDVNLLIALLWPTHEHHAAAHAWFAARGRAKWATCPLTQLAFVRIVSNPAFSPDALAPRDALALLSSNLEHSHHEFWPDALAVPRALAPSIGRIQGHQQLADAYLLGLAVTRKGHLASFDAGVHRIASGRDEEGAVEIVRTR